MDIKDIAAGCIALWEQLKWREAFETYYSDDAVNVEPVDWGDLPAEVVGREALTQKFEWVGREWLIEHGFRVVEGPFYSANRFAILIENDVTDRETGERAKFREIGVYTVEDGKVAREEFLYNEAQLASAMRLN